MAFPPIFLSSNRFGHLDNGGRRLLRQARSLHGRNRRRGRVSRRRCARRCRARGAVRQKAEADRDRGVDFPHQLLVQMLFSIFWPDKTTGFIGWWNTWIGAGSWVYAVLLSLLILAFAYFWSMIQFDTEEISRQIQQNGGFIQGIRPGRATADYLGKINKRITLFGAIFLAFMALIPTLLFTAIGTGGLNGAFSATGMLIVVSVALEFDKQLEAQLMMKNYRGFLK